MPRTRQHLPQPAPHCQLLPAGYDGGNGFAKLLLQGEQIRCPSYILPVHDDLFDAPASENGGLVHYISGSRKDLANTRWLAGMPAYRQSPKQCLRLVDHPRGKLTFGLQLLLGAIASLPWQEEWHLGLVASIQDAQAFGTELKALLDGQHTVRFGDRDQSHIHITMLSVVEEGVGAIITAHEAIDLGGQTLLYDFGNGTCIVSVFGPKGKLVERTVTPGGVESLIDAIATNLQTRRHLAGEGDRHIIRAGIEDQTFRYGQTDWTFQTIYEQELPRWVRSTLAPTLRAASPWRPTSSTVLAIGGGSELPAIAALLAQQGIHVLGGGALAHVHGLLTLADAQLAREEVA